MTIPLPESARIAVSSQNADRFLGATEELPRYGNEEFYNDELQQQVHDRIRQCCLEEFDWLVEEVGSRLAKWPYCALVSGLKFDENNRLFVAINRAFGELVARPYEKPRAQLVHYIQPSTDRPSIRGSQFESEKLHTDTADWDPPVKLISMVCVRPDDGGGGRSRVLDVDTLRDAVKEKLGPETLSLLETEPVPWQLAAYQQGGVAYRNVLSPSNICWRRYTIDLALDSTGEELSDQVVQALDALDEVVGANEGTIDFLMGKGDLLFMDNHRTIHARTPLTQSAAESNRLMIRSWIRVANS